jgi:hypothetical protein
LARWLPDDATTPAARTEGRQAVVAWVAARQRGPAGPDLGPLGLIWVRAGHARARFGWSLQAAGPSLAVLRPGLRFWTRQVQIGRPPSRPEVESTRCDVQRHGCLTSLIRPCNRNSHVRVCCPKCEMDAEVASLTGKRGSAGNGAVRPRVSWLGCSFAVACGFGQGSTCME